MDCPFQGTSSGELRNHINLKHRANVNKKMDGNIECRNCGERFNDKRNLMKKIEKKNIQKLLLFAEITLKTNAIFLQKCVGGTIRKIMKIMSKKTSNVLCVENHSRV